MITMSNKTLVQNLATQQNGLPHHLPQPLGYGRVGALDLNIYIQGESKKSGISKHNRFS